jgi:hypothetical protein
MGILSDDQFAARVNAGGASRRLFTHTEESSGIHMADTYAVGQPGHERSLTHPIVRQQVHDHEKELLNDPLLVHSQSAVQGGWLRSATPPKKVQRVAGQPKRPAKIASGEVVLDASKLRKGREPAVAEGRSNKQEAVFDMEHGRDVYTERRHTSPTATSRASGRRATGYVMKTHVLGSRAPRRAG